MTTKPKRPKRPSPQNLTDVMRYLGSMTSPAKAAASRANGRRGGRPKKSLDKPTG